MQKFLFQKDISHTKASFSTAELSRLGPVRDFMVLNESISRHQPGRILNRHLHHSFIKRNVQSIDFVFFVLAV